MNESSLLQLRNALSRFVKLSDEDWNLLLSHLEERYIPKHGLFAKEGKIAQDVGFVVDGSMRHFYTKDGEEKTTYFYFEGHLVSSYISCIKQAPSELTIEAITDCTLLVFSYKALQKLFDLSHTWERFGRMVSEYLAIGLEERMVGLLLLSPEERGGEHRSRDDGEAFHIWDEGVIRPERGGGRASHAGVGRFWLQIITDTRREPRGLSLYIVLDAGDRG